MDAKGDNVESGLDKERIIQEIARRHRILLSPDDPIFAALAMNDVVLSAYIAKVQESIEHLAGRVEEVTHHYTQDSRAIARQIVGQAVQQALGQIQAGAGQISAQMAADMRAVLAEQQALARQARRAGRVALLAAAATVLASAAVLFGIALAL